MEDLLLPAVVATAVRLKRAPVFVTADEVAGLPLFADFEWIVGKVVRLAPEVLPIMRIDALCFVVLLIVGTPLRLKVVHVEVVVSLHLVDEWRLNVRVGVRKRAVLLILTLGLRLRAKLGLVPLDVIQTLHFVMSKLTVLVLTVLCLAEVYGIGNHGGTAALVKVAVEVGAVLRVVLVRVGTGHGFEPLEVHMA